MSWFNDSKRVKCDVLVIGSGGAGLRAAIAAAEAGAIVLMVSKSRIGQVSNTILSKSVIAASGLGSNDDSAIKHGLDTLEGGRYLNDLAIVNRFTEAIQSEVEQLRKEKEKEKEKKFEEKIDIRVNEKTALIESYNGQIPTYEELRESVLKEFKQEGVLV